MNCFIKSLLVIVLLTAHATLAFNNEGKNIHFKTFRFFPKPGSITLTLTLTCRLLINCCETRGLEKGEVPAEF